MNASIEVRVRRHVGSVPDFGRVCMSCDELSWELEFWDNGAVEVDFVTPLWSTYVLLVTVENHFFHSFRASSFRMPWRMIGYQYSLTSKKDSKKSWNTKVASLDGVPLAANPNPQPSPNSEAESNHSIFSNKCKSIFFRCASSLFVWVLTNEYHNEDKHNPVEDVEDDKGSNQANVEG